MNLNLSEDDLRFIVTWTVASVIGWSAALALGGAVLALGLLLALVLPAWLTGLFLPLCGAVIGGVVGGLQWFALYGDDDSRRWIWASAAGGALSGVPAGVLLLLVPSDVVIARLALGAILAAGIAGAQVIGTAGRVWRMAVYWVLFNTVAGALCALLGPAGARAWLPVTCLIGTGLFGVITGVGMLWLRRQP